MTGRARSPPSTPRRTFSTDPTYYGLKFITTIHNLGYQGIFPTTALAQMGLDESLLTPNLLEFFGGLNLMKGALVLSDAITTVSPTYAREIQEEELGFGLDGVLRARSSVVSGILNGVDYREWSPETDRHTSRPSTRPRIWKARPSANATCWPSSACPRRATPRSSASSPASSTRRASTIIAEIAPGHRERRRQVSGGSAAVSRSTRTSSATWPPLIRTRWARASPTTNRLAHRIEAGSDMFLMPSMYEPCGLNQIYQPALRYRAGGPLDRRAG